MDYPPGFPDDLKPPVESALASEEIAFTQARKEARTWHPDVVETLIKRYIRRVMLVFADSACRAVEKGRWNGDDFRKAFDKYLRSLTQYVWTRKHPRPWDQAAMIDLSRGALTGIEESEEWLAIQDRLRTAARGVNASVADLAAPVTEQAVPVIANQIDSLRLECDLTIEELAGKIGIDPTNVSRHVRGLAIPSRKTRREYEQFFSKSLKRPVLLNRTQPKRS